VCVVVVVVGGGDMWWWSRRGLGQGGGVLGEKGIWVGVRKAERWQLSSRAALLWQEPRLQPGCLIVRYARMRMTLSDTPYIN
jgi:hypothetical protein